MPELPEVEIVRRRLEPHVVGRALCAVQLGDASVSPLTEAWLASILVGRTVQTMRRRGKYLIFDFGDVWAIVHLRMTGQLVFEERDEGREPRFRLLFAARAGVGAAGGSDPGSRLCFYDVRRFGQLLAFEAGAARAYLDARLGVEPLETGFTVDELRRRLAGRTAPLKAFLLDQRRLAGVGNIYADEALFRARLHPLRPAGAVGPRQARRLHAAVIETLKLGIEHEGSSIESFVDPAGERGAFQEILNVYQRTGEPCRVCGVPIRRLVVGGRGTHFCPRCQRGRGTGGKRRRRD